MNLIWSFLIGAVLSFLSSIPLGPVNFAIIQATLKNGKHHGLMIGLGAMVVEFFYCLLSVLGFKLFLDNPGVQDVIHLLSIPLLILLGIISLRKVETEDENKPIKLPKQHNNFLLGASLSITNPMVFAYWIWMTSLLQSKGMLDSTFLSLMIFALGVGAGIFGFFYLVSYITFKQHKRISAETRQKADRIIGIIFLTIAAYMLADYLCIKFLGEKISELLG